MPNRLKSVIAFCAFVSLVPFLRVDSVYALPKEGEPVKLPKKKDDKPSPGPIEIVAPKEGDTVTGNPVTSANVLISKPPLDIIKFYADDKFIWPDASFDDKNGVYSRRWYTAGHPNAPCVLKVVALDHAGNAIAEKEIKVNVYNAANAPHSIKIVSPKNGDTISGKVTLVARITPDDEIVGIVDFYPPYVSVLGHKPADRGNDYELVWDARKEVNGQLTLVVKLYGDEDYFYQCFLHRKINWYLGQEEVTVTVDNSRPNTTQMVNGAEILKNPPSNEEAAFLNPPAQGMMLQKAPGAAPAPDGAASSDTGDSEEGGKASLSAIP